MIYIYDYHQFKTNRSEVYYITLLFFILLAGLRYRIGSDTQDYECSFNSIPYITKLTFYYLTEVSTYEVGYTIFMSIVKTLFKDFSIFLLIQAVIVNYSVFTFFRHNTSKIFTSILLYFIVLYYFINCETARQGIALAILLNSWESYKEAKWKKYFILVLFATLFHTTAIIFIVFPILKKCHLWDKLKPNFLNACLILVIIAISFVLQQIISQFLMQFTMNGDLGGRIYAYYNDADELTGISLTTQVIYLLFYIAVPFYCLHKIKYRYINYSDLAPMIIICSVINVASGIPMVYRLTYYFMPFYFVLLSEALVYPDLRKSSLTEVPKQKLCINHIVILFISLFLYYKVQPYYYNDGTSSNHRYYMRFYPYKSIIDKGLDENREEIYRGL